MARVVVLIATVYLLACCWPSQSAIPQVFENLDVSRTVTLKSYTSKETISLKVKATEDEQQKYIVAAHPETGGQLSGVVATQNQKKEKLDIRRLDDESGIAYFEVFLSSAVRAGETTLLEVVMYRTHALSPFPEEIAQDETQLVKYFGDALFFTPYASATQTSRFVVGRSKVNDFTRLSNAAKSSDAVEYGPFRDIEPFDSEPVEIHFEFPSGLPVFSEVAREVEVSHWGNIAVEEELTMWNKGASLKHGFARVDYQSKQHIGNSFRDMRATLPPHAKDIYYRDIIGNVTTSTIHKTGKKVLFDIQTRFPMFGGWKTVWYQGYNLPTEPYLTVDGDTYTLRTKFGQPFTKASVDDLYVKIVLPETATIVSVSAPVGVDRSDSVRYTYGDMPTAGRPVISLHARNHVNALDGDVVVVYTAPPRHMLREPAMFVGAFFVLFITVMVVRRINLSLK